MGDFTFLTADQVFGTDQLEILKKYGVKCAITDFSILLGGIVSADNYTSEGRTLKDRTSWWWTKSSFRCDYSAHAVDQYGNENWDLVLERYGGFRPVIPYSEISSMCSDPVRDEYGILEVEYGEYPQMVVDEGYSVELERAYNNGSLKTTEKTYTTDSVDWRSIDVRFIAREHTEYEYKGKKYIRFVGDANCNGMTLSNGRKIHNENVFWVSVEPITWLVDKKTDIALSKKIIFSGVQFNNGLYSGDFDRTDIKQFMDTYFSKDIVCDRAYSQPTLEEQTKTIEKKRN